MEPACFGDGTNYSASVTIAKVDSPAFAAVEMGCTSVVGAVFGAAACVVVGRHIAGLGEGCTTAVVGYVAIDRLESTITRQLMRICSVDAFTPGSFVGLGAGTLVASEVHSCL